MSETTTESVDLSGWLDGLTEKLAAATPGPWRYDPREPRTIRDDHPRLPAALVTFRDPGADATLIVAAVNALPELLRLAREGEAVKRAVSGVIAEADRRVRQAVPASAADRLISDGLHTVQVADLRSAVSTAEEGR